MEKDLQTEAAKVLLEQAESFLTTTDFFKHGKMSFIKQLSAILAPILNEYGALFEDEKDEIIFLFEQDLKKILMKE